MIYNHSLLRITFLLFIAAFVACQWTIPPPPPVSIDVPFETVGVNEEGANIELPDIDMKPYLRLLTSPDNISEVKGHITEQDFTKLQQIDFQQDAAIILFRGLQGSYNFQTIIERIVQQDNRLIVYAQFWEPNSEAYTSVTALTSPYHIVKVAQRYVIKPQLQLVLQSRTITPTPPAK